MLFMLKRAYPEANVATCGLAYDGGANPTKPSTIYSSSGDGRLPCSSSQRL